MDGDCKSTCSADTKHTDDLTDDDTSHHTAQRRESKKSSTWHVQQQQHRRSTSPTDNIDTLSPRDILKKRYHQSNFTFVSLADIDVSED